MKLILRLCFILAALSLAGCTCDTVSVPSPDGKLVIRLEKENDSPAIVIDFNGKHLVEPSPIGFELDEVTFGPGVRFVKGRQTSIVDDYEMPVGKASHIHSVSNQQVVKMKSPDGKIIEIHLRAFDDGVAFRYVFPGQEGWDSLKIKSERMEIRPTGNPDLKAMYLPGIRCSHEAPYVTKPLDQHAEGKTADMPVFLNFGNEAFLALTEAMVVDYAGMQLVIRDGVIKGMLSPRLDQPEYAVITDLPHRTPWRVFLVSDRAGALMESNILTTLCDPCQEDYSWIKPGKSTWMWWNGYQAPESVKDDDIGTYNLNISKYYIDFCSRNGIDYHSITGLMRPDGGEVNWYYNEGSTPGSPKEGDNAKEPYPGYDIGQVCNYAREKGVRMRVWIHWSTLAQDIEGTFKKFREWGIDGMMVDFMDRDDQEMIDYETRFLELAMKYHLHIQFHGASKPSGLQRTYPAEFTRENTLNYEVYKWDSDRRMGADHDLNMPFTRCLAGPTDYHLGGFRSVPYDAYQVTPMHPSVTSTRCHMLGMYVVLESALQLVSDAPEAYEGQPGFEFIKEVPVTWDETRVPLAEMDEYVVFARRKGDTWYLGAIGNLSPHDLSVPLDFLGDGAYTLDLYSDAPDADKDPNQLTESAGQVRRSDTLEVSLAASGGFAAKLTPCL